ncbi:MAG: DNA polymerase III subunit chi [Chlamydiales bacterium]
MNPSNPTPTRVIFFQVSDNGTKLKKIVETAHHHFEKKEPILILVDDEKSQKFVDELLWKLPATSFLPHSASDEPTSEFVAVAKVKKNVNGARIAFNLCASSLLMEGPFRIIYEFEDLTTPNKKNLSSQRFDSYKQTGFLIEAR